MSVQFLAGAEIIGSDDTSPYSAEWTAQKTGAIQLFAVATYGDGRRVISAPVPVNVLQAVEGLAGFRTEMPVHTPAQPFFGFSQAISQSIYTVPALPGSGPLNVAVRFRGLMEPVTISNPISSDGQFTVGGVEVSNGADSWKLEVRNPPQVYYLNNGVSLGFNPDVPFVTGQFRLDLTKVIQVASGATVTVTANSNDGASGLNNARIVVPGVAPAPLPSR